MDGASPTPQFLGRIRRGEIAGVVLLGDNIGRSGPTGLIAQLQAAARAGGQPPLLIAIDQEGGSVRRLTVPPTLAPREMTSVSVAQSQGVATGRALRRLGVTVDLAPVLDVPTSTGSFIADRSFSFDANAVAARGVAFANGLLQGGVASTAKHFPGLGRLRQNTDFGAGRVDASRQALERDLLPFRAAVRAGMPAVMVGTASYPAYGSSLPAACVPAVVDGLLRRRLGFRGAILTDDLGTPAVSALIPPLQAVVRAVHAGVDLVYITSPTGSDDVIGERAYAALLQAARRGQISLPQLNSSYNRIIALKRAGSG